MSAESREAICAVLSRHYSDVVITLVNNTDDLEGLVRRQPDLVFLGMKFVPGNLVLGSMRSPKVWLSDYLDAHGIAYTGSGQGAHRLELNKPLAKQRVLDAGLQTSSFHVYKQNVTQVRSEMLLTFPLFIKPTNRGGGMGIDSASVAHNFDQLDSKVLSITIDLKSDSLIEEYLPGREFSVAILKDKNSTSYSVMPIELVAAPDKNGLQLLSEEMKASNEEVVLAVSDPVIKAKVCELALNVFHALGARDYGRIDIRLDKTGMAQFLEANLIPSLISGYGSFPKACSLNMTLDYESMLLRIVELGLSRAPQVSTVSVH